MKRKQGELKPQKLLKLPCNFNKLKRHKDKKKQQRISGKKNLPLRLKLKDKDRLKWKNKG